MVHGYVLQTTEYRADHGVYCYISRFEIRDNEKVIAVPAGNCGTHIWDATSPFIVDRLVFDVFHIATDINSEYREELLSEANIEESDCPLRALGVAHYEEKGEQAIWHDDLGDYTVTDGLDLHY